MKNAFLSTFLFCVCTLSSSFAQNFDGFALYNLQNQNTTYLIDKDQNIAYSWSCNVACNYSVKLRDNGNLVRGGVYSGNQLNGAAVGGMMQEIDPSGAVVWEYVYSNSNHCSHHDFTLLPNGNVILTAWEVKSTSELTQAGRSNVTSSMWPTHFVELQPDGAGSATIVWEWHMWDHMIQDYNSTKDNYGVVADHPELMDINAVTAGGGGGPQGGGDWFHTNGIDYNPELDQLVFSSRYASEIFVIDHSTTTSEAASHAGGNSGKGGDFLYRWGNPSNYGVAGTQTIPAAVHDPRWITDDGRPNGGYIEFFNNEGGSNGGSVIDAVNAPESGFMYTLSGSSYGPASYDWRHVCLTSNSGQGSHNRMSNGNTFVNVSNHYMYEVDQNGNLIWQYNAGPPKAFRYECDDPGIVALLGADPCGLLSLTEKSLENLMVYPNPSATGIFTIGGVNTADQNVEVMVMDAFGKLVLQTSHASSIDLSEMEDGIYFATMYFSNGASVVRKLSVVR